MYLLYFVRGEYAYIPVCFVCTRHPSIRAPIPHRPASSVQKRKMSSRSMSGMSSRELKEAAARLPFYRLRFADGYVFRHKANSEQELITIAANHYWWGEEKPAPEDIRLTIKSRRNNTRVGN